MQHNRTQIASFKKIVRTYYKVHSRTFPWRKTKNPYRILVSEVMLQQTQTGRVVSYYKTFLKQFPTIQILAQASLREVLSAWQGLGYNRRAKALRETAQIIVEKYNGTVPSTRKELERLPGIGPYIAGAILSFAYNKPAVFVETNIRTVFIHFFFKGKNNVKDSDILPFVDQTLDKNNPREWYQALMDYGVMLKKNHLNPSRRSVHHTLQSTFEGSDRQIRGRILKMLINERKLRKNEITKKIKKSSKRVNKQLTQLVTEGFIAVRNDIYMVA